MTEHESASQHAYKVKLDAYVLFIPLKGCSHPLLLDTYTQIHVIICHILSYYVLSIPWLP